MSLTIFHHQCNIKSSHHMVYTIRTVNGNAKNKSNIIPYYALSNNTLDKSIYQHHQCRYRYLSHYRDTNCTRHHYIKYNKAIHHPHPVTSTTRSLHSYSYSYSHSHLRICTNLLHKDAHRYLSSDTKNKNKNKEAISQSNKGKSMHKITDNDVSDGNNHNDSDEISLKDETLSSWKIQYSKLSKDQKEEFNEKYLTLISPLEYRLYYNKPIEFQKSLKFHENLDKEFIKSLSGKYAKTFKLSLNKDTRSLELNEYIDRYLSDYTRLQERIDELDIENIDHMNIDHLVKEFSESQKMEQQIDRFIQQSIEKGIKLDLPKAMIDMKSKPTTVSKKSAADVNADEVDELPYDLLTDIYNEKDEHQRKNKVKQYINHRIDQSKYIVPVTKGHAILTDKQLNSNEKYIKLNEDQYIEDYGDWFIDPNDRSPEAEGLREKIAEYSELTGQLPDEDIGNDDDDNSFVGLDRSGLQYDRENIYNLADATDDVESKYADKNRLANRSFKKIEEKPILSHMNVEEEDAASELYNEIEEMYDEYLDKKYYRQRRDSVDLVNIISTSKFLGYGENGDEVYRYYYNNENQSSTNKRQKFEDFTMSSQMVKDLFDTYHYGEGTYSDRKNEELRQKQKQDSIDEFIDEVDGAENTYTRSGHRMEDQNQEIRKEQFNPFPIPKSKSWYERADKSIELPPGPRDGVTSWPRVPILSDWPHPIQSNPFKSIIEGTERIDPDYEGDEYSERKEEIEERNIASDMLKQNIRVGKEEIDDMKAENKVIHENKDTDQSNEEEDQEPTYVDEEGNEVEYDPPLTNPAFYHLSAVQKLLHIDRLQSTRTFIKMEKIRRLRIRERAYRDIRKYKDITLVGEESDSASKYKYHNPRLVQWLRLNYNTMLDTVHNQNTWKGIHKEEFALKLQKIMKKIYYKWNHKHSIIESRNKKDLARSAKTKANR